MRFDREVLLPDVGRVVGGTVEGLETRLRDDLQSGFDALAQRLDRLETEYQMLLVGLRRVEERLESIGKRAALRTEVPELRSKMASLEARLAERESDI